MYIISIYYRYKYDDTSNAHVYDPPFMSGKKRKECADADGCEGILEMAAPGLRFKIQHVMFVYHT